MIPAILFNEHESPEKVIARLCLEQDADIVVPFDCADPRVPFMVRGFFVVPKNAAFKWVGNEKPA